MTWSTSDVAVCCSKLCRKIARALAKFAEQPRVLDGDDRLGGEARDQGDLFVSKGANCLAQRENEPISALFLTIGTARNVCIPPSSTAATVSGSRSI